MKKFIFALRDFVLRRLRQLKRPVGRQNADSFYCALCGSCGETGCCSPVKCVTKLLKYKPKHCLYGAVNVRDVLHLYFIGQELFELAYKDPSWRKKCDELYDKYEAIVERYVPRVD